MNPKVSIIVLNWNGCRDTIECLESLRKVTYPNYEVIVVDNGSTDGSEKVIKERFPDILVLQTGENTGYAKGNNFGIRHALKNGADYVLLLNNDTVVDPEFVIELVKVAESDKSIGILSSKIYFYDRATTLWFAGGKFSLRTGWSKHIGYGKKDTGQFNEIREIDRACGCAMMVTRKLCEEMGLMDEDYFCYCEETDWSLRAKKMGYKIVYVPSSKVWHKVSSSTQGMKSARYIYFSVRNTLRCLEKNAPYRWSVVSIIREVFVIVLYIGSLFTLRVEKLKGIRYIYQGVIDFHNNKFGNPFLDL